MFVKISTPLVSDHNELFVVVAPHHRWIAGLVRKASTTDTSFEELFNRGLQIAAENLARAASVANYKQQKAHHCLLQAK